MKNISRRDFLKQAMAAALSAALLPRGPSLFAQGPETVDLVVVKGDKVKALKKALEAYGGISRFVKPQDRVLIKPNISIASPPEWGATTSPEVIVGVARACLDAGAKRVIVADYPLRAPVVCYEKCGLKKALEELKEVDVLLLTQERFFVETEVPKGLVLKSTKIARELSKTDVLISLPTAKSHSATGVSMGLKGLMGLIWDRGYFHQDVDLNQAIADLATVIKPKLIIMDASRALTSGGPGGPGVVKELNTIVAGVDPVAVDSYTVGLTKWYNKVFLGKNVKHIALASKMGLGEIDVGKLKIKETSV